MSRQGLLVVAGEASGDLHGARLLSALSARLPELEAFGMGGERMRRERFDAVADSGDIAVVGIWEALRLIPRARRALHRLLEEVERRRPVAAVLIDAPDFNLRLARRLKQRGVPVVYYVSPQIWAWRRRRVEAIRERVEKMLVLFGFEEEFYRGYGVGVAHVGHPLVDEVPSLPHLLDRHGEIESGEPLRVALLPGSREGEVHRLLPLMREAVEALGRERQVEAVLIEATSVSEERFDEALEGATVPLERIRDPDRRFAALAACHVALCASGTATLEVGLVGTPMVVVYRVAALTSLLARFLLRVPYVSLVNLVMGRRVVPELLQNEAEPRRIARAVGELGQDDRLGRMHRELAGLRSLLGEPGASERAADEVVRVMGKAA